MFSQFLEAKQAQRAELQAQIQQLDMEIAGARAIAVELDDILISLESLVNRADSIILDDVKSAIRFKCVELGIFETEPQDPQRITPTETITTTAEAIAPTETMIADEPSKVIASEIVDTPDTHSDCQPTPSKQKRKRRAKAEIADTKAAEQRNVNWEKWRDRLSRSCNRDDIYEILDQLQEHSLETGVSVPEDLITKVNEIWEDLNTDSPDETPEISESTIVSEEMLSDEAITPTQSELPWDTDIVECENINSPELQSFVTLSSSEAYPVSMTDDLNVLPVYQGEIPENEETTEVSIEPYSKDEETRLNLEWQAIADCVTTKAELDDLHQTIRDSQYLIQMPTVRKLDELKLKLETPIESIPTQTLSKPKPTPEIKPVGMWGVTIPATQRSQSQVATDSEITPDEAAASILPEHQRPATQQPVKKASIWDMPISRSTATVASDDGDNGSAIAPTQSEPISVTKGTAIAQEVAQPAKKPSLWDIGVIKAKAQVAADDGGDDDFDPNEPFVDFAQRMYKQPFQFACGSVITPEDRFNVLPVGTYLHHKHTDHLFQVVSWDEATAKNPLNKRDSDRIPVKTCDPLYPTQWSSLRSDVLRIIEIDEYESIQQRRSDELARLNEDAENPFKMFEVSA